MGNPKNNNTGQLTSIKKSEQSRSFHFFIFMVLVIAI